jgi:exodeoxyribonuclease V alpha subunit
MEEEIYGFVENVVFESDNFTVAKLKEPRKSELTCIVGPLPLIQPGETLRCKGLWKHHPQHGQQFEVRSFESKAPADVVGIQKYLESGMIRGIGPVYAERIVKKFGIDTLKVIDESPAMLREIDGIGDKRVELIESCWQQQKAVRDVMIFLRSHGVSPSYAQKIYKAYGDQSIEKVRSDPYRLAKDIHGIGFKSADQIAKDMGIPVEADVRIDAGIEHMLWELSNQGHTCFPETELLSVSAEILGVNPDLVEKRIGALAQEERIFREDSFVWVKPLYFSELGIARELRRINDSLSPLRAIQVDKAMGWVEEKLQLKLAPAQKEAVSACVKEKIHIITGGPGTGKSTITRAILAITEKLTGNIILAAPTGRAAKRMSEITKKKASTIHSLLEMDFKLGGFKKNKDNPLEGDLIIVDEASMIDTLLMYHLLKAIPSHARVIFIGDIDQLPSVGPGNVLKDLIFSEKISLTKLTQIFRQGASSRIVLNAHRINQGEFPDISYQPRSDFDFIEKETPEEILTTIVELVSSKLSKSHRFHRFEDIQVLAPMKRGIIGIENLNIVLQNKLNPSPTPLSRMGRIFHVGDKVMQIRNNYQKIIFNGDVGRITAIDLIEQTLTVAFDEKLINYEFSEMDELMLAYAVSIHKYQGSECPCIIIPVHTTHFKMLHRNLLYTGLTRGKKMVILIGTKKALMLAIKNDEVLKRHTGLKRRIQA